MTRKRTNDEFVQELKTRGNNEYRLIDEYISNQEKVILIHIVCGYEWKTRPNDFITGKRCPRCSGKERINTDRFIEIVYSLTSGEYSVLGEYVNNWSKILMRHNVCSHEWMTVPSSFTQGHGCPKCKSSIGEKRIHKFLEKNKISFFRQFKFDDCKNKKPLPFDFYLPDYNLCIEYNGEQHYRIPRNNYFGGEESYKQRKINDRKKISYCRKSNISLLVIPYWEADNIDKILSENLYGIETN